jgi:hypothetical protein
MLGIWHPADFSLAQRELSAFNERREKVFARTR